MILNKEKLIQILENMFEIDSSGHDITHLTRVTNLAMKIQKIEGGDPDVIEAAALLHDVHRIIENKSGVYCSPENSLPTINKILKEIDFDELKIDKVLNAIEHHEEYIFSTGKISTNIEDLIVQDADNLDAMGAIGIARAFAFGGAKKCPIYNPNIPIEIGVFTEENIDPSEIHHIYNKLLRLKDNMNTTTGKKMAKKRHDFMEEYIKQFFTEWEEK